MFAYGFNSDSSKRVGSTKVVETSKTASTGLFLDEPPYSGATYNLRYQASEKSIRVVKNHTLNDLIERYLDILWENGKHKDNVRSFLGEIAELLNGLEFSTFSQELVDSLVLKLKARGNSNATINRKMAALSKLLRKACKMGDIHSLPEFRRQKERNGRIRFLEHNEEARLFDAIKRRDTDAWRLAIFLVDSGARIGEAIDLRWNDISEHRATFWITKSGRSRTIPLTRRALETIDIPRGRLLGPFSMLNQVHFRSIWNDAKAEIGLGCDKQVVPHILRHTCASRLVRGGVDLRRVQMWLGHQTLQMTMRYAHLATHDLDGCVKVLEREPELMVN